MATMRDALKKESLEVEAKLAYVPLDGFVGGLDDLVGFRHTYTHNMMT